MLDIATVQNEGLAIATVLLAAFLSPIILLTAWRMLRGYLMGDTL